MADAAQQKASHGDVDHGLGDVDALLVVADQAPPSGQPAEGPYPTRPPRAGERSPGMIDTRKLKELVRLMVENELSELDLRDKDETVTIKRGGEGAPVVHAAPAMVNGSAPAASAPAATADAPAAPPADDGLAAIESPMVGTYYSAPNPDSDPYVTPGAQVSPGAVVCILEAMKVFNEIKSEVSGTVERVLVKNGDAVEFGQKLMLVKPS